MFYIQILQNQWIKYQKEHPALEISLLALSLLSVYIRMFYAIFALAIIAFLSPWRRILFFQLPFCLLLLGALYAYKGPYPKEAILEGRAKVYFQERQAQRGFFGPFWMYRGTLIELETKEKTYKHLPLVCYLKQGDKVLCDQVYEIEAKVKKRGGYGFQLKISPTTPIKFIRRKVSLSTLSRQFKDRYKRWVKSKLKTPVVSAFFIGLTTGEFSHPFMSFTFSRFGLNHLLAISGFHFGLLIFLLNTLFYFISMKRLKRVLLILSVTFFALFIGFSPSLFRAWIMTILYLAAYLLERPPKALNILSCAFLFSILKEPLIITHLGFQYSFLITFSILTYYPLFKKIKVFQSKHCLLSALGSALSLALSVNLAALPLTLFAFHKFYLMSLLANFIIPPLVACLLFLFALFSGLSLLSVPKMVFLWGFLERMTDLLLKGICELPTSWDYCMRLPHFPLVALWAYGACLFLFPLFFKGLNDKKESKDNPNSLTLQSV